MHESRQCLTSVCVSMMHFCYISHNATCVKLFKAFGGGSVKCPEERLLGWSNCLGRGTKVHKPIVKVFLLAYVINVVAYVVNVHRGQPFPVCLKCSRH